MAKTARPSPEKVTAMEELIEEIVAHASREEILFQLEGTPTAPVKYADGSYKNKPLIAGWEYFLTGGYVGVKGVPIFSFTPEDDQEYETVEFNLNQLDDFLPMVGPMIAASQGLEGVERAADAFTAVLSLRMKALESSKDEAVQKLNTLPNFGRFA